MYIRYLVIKAAFYAAKYPKELYKSWKGLISDKKQIGNLLRKSAAKRQGFQFYEIV